MDRLVFKPEKRLQPGWVWAMAWRDARRNLNRLLLFISSIVLGVAALVAISSFGDNLRADIDLQSKNLLGADLRITTGQRVGDSIHSWYDTLGVNRAWESTFASNVYFPRAADTRLVQIRALEGDFPFYGVMDTDPPGVSPFLKDGPVAIVDRGLMEQFGTVVGDSIRVGKLNFRVVGLLDKVPGANEIVSLVAAPVYIPRRYLPETGLMRYGSQVRTNLYFQLPDSVNADSLKNELYDELYAQGWGFETVTDRQASLGNTFDGLTRFLNLVAFVALLLGCIGVASSVHIYITEKIRSVAILRTLGAQARQGVWIFLVQISLVGLIGSILGVAVGVAIQYYLPVVLGPFLPFQVTISLSGFSIAQGILTGLTMAILFALFPLLSVRKVAPLRVLRAGVDDERLPRDWARIWIAIGVLVFVGSFAYWQVQSLREAVFFTLFMVGGFGLLIGAARLLMWVVRKFFPQGWRFTLRQGLANLYRPHNQTTILIAAIGLGATLIATLSLTQDMLLEEVSINSGENQPNVVLFDIQPDQLDDVREIIGRHPVTPVQETPVVAVRYHTIRGLSIDTLLLDTTLAISRRQLIGEQRVSYRSELMDGETLVDGNWQGSRSSAQDSIFVSYDERLADRMGLELGDEIVFDVQGVKLSTYVGSFRDIETEGMRTNFAVVFPTGVLEKAPQFYISSVRSKSAQETATFRKDVVQFFPTISIIDLGTIIRTIDDVLDQISFVVQFMALFSILTGVLVLIGSVTISKYQQIRESVLLRTLGASRRQIIQITLLEYFFLGSLASLSGILLSLVATALLARYSFEIPFHPQWIRLAILYLGITGLTVIIGTLNLRGVISKPPLTILRENQQ